MTTRTPAAKPELLADFAYNDGDQDGYVSFEEFLSLLDQLDADIGKQEARIGFAEIDTDKNGLIDFDEFVAWWSEA